MKLRRRFVHLVLFSALTTGSVVAARESARTAPANDATALPVVQSSDADTMRIEGERRFRANCGRCHAAPQKFPPRVMKTVIRHMRVRATITDEDTRMILFYMTQ